MASTGIDERQVMTPHDAELVDRARRGDREAFAELVERWQRPLFARALRSTRRVDDADDLVQETFLRAWRGLRRFRDGERAGRPETGDGSRDPSPSSGFGGWLLQILAHVAIDRGRRGGREVVGIDETWLEALPDARPGPEQELLAGELEGAVKEACDALPPGRRQEVFRMRFVEGRRVQDIAEELGVHTGTVKVHLYRLARELRRRLVGKEEA